ncbi:flavonol sulfotransferase-like [Gossypium arboreum]|uniref:flavonol sulfotransferase-like n=1 Tax=Gossypium arboreum TaxID=29729 RepID=UPI0022F1CC0E|nr:flavonol sulfotransferase-like [Gossypium arboreum]
MLSGSQAQAKVQRLRDQIAQMQASTVEQIAEVQRKYEELQQQLIADQRRRKEELDIGEKGFWFGPAFLQGALSAQQQFQAQPTDIILCSSQRTGTALLKSLTFATITRTSYDDSTTTLLSMGHHYVVPFMEFDHAQFSTNRHLGIPLLATHLPYSFLPKSIIDSGCVSPYGPDHILGYWKASLEHPDKLMFLKYEELVEDTVLYLKKTAEFMCYPFSSEEQQQGVPENIVKMCSFENLSGLGVNKTGKHRDGQGKLGMENNIFFRKGKLGDWKNYLTTEMAQHLDQRTMQKLSGSGLSL